MSYKWNFHDQFAKEFKNFPKDQQDKILDFIEIYELHGLRDFNAYEGKVGPSYKTNDLTSRQYALAHSFWHYHIGIPTYRQSLGGYKTSDWVLHFQWFKSENYIVLVDLYYHYKSDGTFYLPPSGSLFIV
ncbi:hypothetical protein [Marinomonas shanghaiensis]|uniref:hypothetical protein n=1 Tax=Marinomonas shanghaiensis TaxID=2202418 RepID=UPI003A8CD1CE